LTIFTLIKIQIKMKKNIFILLICALVSNSFALTSEASTAFEKPILFMENKGQVVDINGHSRPDVLYTLSQNGVKLFFTSKGIYYQLVKFNSGISDEKFESKSASFFRLDMNLINANENTKPIASQQSEYYENFYLASCPKGITNVHGYSKITYPNIYPEIDWVIYFKDNKLKYDFVVRPGGDPNQIKIAYKNSEQTALESDGSISIKTPLGEIREGAPVCWTSNDHTIVPAKFNVVANELKFQLETYDNSQTLIIDPSIVWSRYFGSVGADEINKIAGSIAAGTTTSTFGLLPTSGYQNTNAGLEDAFYLVFNPNSTGTVSYCTYFGGSGNDKALSAIFIADGSQPKVAIAGVTQSAGIVPSGSSSSDKILNGMSDGFISIFLQNGSLLYGTYVGGNGEDTITEIKNVTAGTGVSELIVSGTTSSTDLNNKVNSFNGITDGFIGALTVSASGIALTKSAYFGGPSADKASSLSIGKDKYYFISGITESSTGIATPGAYDVGLAGVNDAFVAKFDSNFVVQWASYYGGTQSESYGNYSGSYIVTDSINNVYLTGGTASFDINSPFTDPGKYKNSNQGNWDIYLIKFNQNGQKVWWTYFGGSLDDIANAISLNAFNKLILGGWTTSPSLEIDKNGLDMFAGLGHLNSDIDALLLVFNTSGNFKWSTPFGSVSGLDFCKTVSTTNSTIIFGGKTTSITGLNIGTASSYSSGDDGFLARMDDFAIKTGSINVSSFCPNDSLQITYQAIGDFPPGTIFSARLYTNNITNTWYALGDDLTNSGIINGVIPANTPQSFSGNSIKVVTGTLPGYTVNSTSQTIGPIGSLPLSHIVALGSTQICEGSSVVLKSPSSTNISFRQWYKQINNQWVTILGANAISYFADSAGSYKIVTTSVSGCDSTSNSITVTVQPVPDALISSASQVFCLGDNLILNANTGVGLSYQWYKNSLPMSGRISDTLIVNQSGYYSVRVTNAGGCSTLSSQFVATSLPKPSAIISSQGITKICEGQNRVLTAGGSSLGLFYAWYKNDTLIPGATFQSYAVTVTGDYYVKELNSYSCSDSSNTIHIDVYPYPTPSIQYSGLPYTCLGSTINLVTQYQINYTYQWLNNGIVIAGAIDTIYSSVSGGNYSVVVTNQGICSDTSIVTEINPAPEVTQICYATIDTAFNKYVVKLFWQKPSQAFIKGYVIYREISGQGFVPIDTVLNTEYSSYVDTSSRPESTVERYKIATLDSCGTQNDISTTTIHQTMLLQGAIDPTNTYIGWDWEPYLGINDGTRFYRIMRDTYNTGVWDSIKATPWSVTSWNDTAINYPSARYAVDLVWQDNCSPSQRILLNKSTSRSNIKNRNALLGIQRTPVDANQLSIYPNPTQGEVMLEFELKDKAAHLYISDLLGRIVFEAQLSELKGKTQLKLDLAYFSKGIYTVNLQTETAPIIRKLAIE
jgi:Secretion system C-terminal sorting domain/Ig-like domain CHU_C associated